ncbi:MAG: hypothetical protein KAU83_03695 [Bacteroidales bacterium]|nr:hypothetical protein [Bacteroidales bacterium]
MKKLFLSLPILIFVLVYNVYSQDISFRPFLGVSANYIILTGSFDGESFFETENEIIFVPKIEPNFGFGVQGGIRFDNFSLDFAFHRSEHHYFSSDEQYSGKCVINIVRYLGVKGYFNKGKKIRPYIDFDLSGSWSNFEKIAYNRTYPDESLKANYGGIILGFGGGLSIDFSEKFSLDIRMLPEWYIGTDIKAKNSDRYEIKKFSNFLLVSSIGLCYFFQSR